jgi:GT2 family glycosyltransferase
LENDVLLEKDYLQMLKYETGRIDGMFVGGGKILPVFEQQKPPWLIKFFMPLLAEVNLKEKYKEFPSRLYPFGINMLVHREVFETIGFFDLTPEIKHGPDHLVLSEKRFVDKARKAGIPVYYFPNLVVWNYIPPEHLSRAYIRKQAEINLQVEIRKAKEKGKVKFGRFLFREFLKFTATFGIGLYYILTTQWEKLKSLFQYRYWSFKVIFRHL